MQTRKTLPFFLCFLLVVSVFAQFQMPQVNAANTNIPESYVYMNGNINTGTWTNPTYAYNNATGNAATKAWTPAGYSTYLVLNCSSMVIGNKIRFWVGRSNTAITTMQIDVANKTGNWVNVYSTTPQYVSAYINASFTQRTYTAIRLRFSKTGTVSRTASIFEVQAVNNAYTIPDVLVDLSKWDSVFKISSTVIGNVRYNVYNITNGIELDAIFTKKTVIPSITWAIQSSNVVLVYQPPLTSEFVVGGFWQGSKISFVNSTNVMNGTVSLVYRPLNVVGSYAVYSSTKRNNQYGTGKLFHVYRPYLIDALGKISWASITIASNALAVSFNQTWLNLAEYPVTLDPSFGKTGIGLTEGGTGGNYATASTYQMDAVVGYITSISMYAYTKTGTCNVKMGIYNSTSNNTPAALVENSTTINTITTTAGWWTWTMASKSLKASAYYGLTFRESAQVYIKYDSGSTNQWSYKSLTYTSAWNDPFGTRTGGAAAANSVYANYTVVTTKSVIFSCSEIASITSTIGMKKALRFSESQIVEITQTLSYHKDLCFRQTDTIIMAEATSKTISIRIRNSETSSFLSDLSKRIAVTLRLSETSTFLSELRKKISLSLRFSETPGFILQMNQNKELRFLSDLTINLVEAFGMHFGEFLKFLEVSASETISPTTTMGIQKNIHIKLPLIAEVLSDIYRAIELGIKNLEFPLLETPNFSVGIVTKTVGNIQGLGGYSMAFILAFAIIACIVTACVVTTLRKKQD